MSGAGKGRPRYRGDAATLAATLSPYATEPAWFRYSEKANGRGSIQGKVLRRHAAMFRDLRRLAPNMSFSQSLMVAACKIISRNKNAEWNLTDDQIKRQTKALATRLRIACRHVSQAARKPKLPAWCAAIVDDTGAKVEDSGQDEQEAGEEEEREVDEEVDLTEETAVDEDRFKLWGFDPELGVAWRASGMGKDREMQSTTDLFAASGAKPSDPMVARFQAGGREYKLSDLTVEAWQMRTNATAAAAKRRTGAPQPLWEGKHLPTGARLTIRHRADRRPLVILFMDTVQVLQVPLAAFKDTKAAVDFVSVLGT